MARRKFIKNRCSDKDDRSLPSPVLLRLPDDVFLPGEGGKDHPERVLAGGVMVGEPGRDVPRGPSRLHHLVDNLRGSLLTIGPK